MEMIYRSELSYLIKVGILLTKEEIARISLLVLKGHTLTEIAKIYGCSYSKVAVHFRFEYNPKKTKIFLGHKKEAYYDNEDDYVRLPKYSFETLTEQEKQLIKKQDEHTTKST